MLDVNIPTTAPTLAAMATAADGLQAYNNVNAFGGSAPLNGDYAQLVATATAFDWCNQSPYSSNNCSVGGNSANADYAQLVATATAFDWCNQSPNSSNNCSVGGNSANNTANSTVPHNISFMVLTYILLAIFITVTHA